MKRALQKIYQGWVSYKKSDDRNSLNGAYQEAFLQLKTNSASLPLCFCCIFLNIEKGAFDKAGEMIDALTSNKSYFKNNEPHNYAFYLFLNSLFELRCNKHRAGKKYYRILEEYSVGKDDYIYDLLLAALKLESYEFEAAYECLKNASLRGANTPFFYFCIHTYYSSELNTKAKAAELFLPFMKWALAHDINLEKTAELYKEEIIKLIAASGDLSRSLMVGYPADWVLGAVCESYVKKNDYSESAFQVYHEAITRQIFTKDINDAFIKAAFKKGYEDISRYSVVRFLESPLDIEIKPFIYHLILNSKKMRGLLPNVQTELIQFAIYSLENNLRGRYYNSTYKYLIEVSEEENIPKDQITKAEMFMISDLFLFDVEVESDECKFLWIQEKEKKGMKVYAIENKRAQIKAVNENFGYYFLGGGQKKFLDLKLKITKRIENADIKLYQHFFRKKLLSTELLIELSKYYLSMEKQDELGVEVLRRTLAEPALSYSFRMTASAILGGIYYLNGDYETALSYYKELDENYLQDKQLEQMLLTFIVVKDYAAAVNLIIKKSGNISEKVLFHAIKQIDDESYYPHIATTCYDLILKSWYDKFLLSIVMRYYTAAQEEWQELSFFLSRMLVEESELDEKILESAVNMSTFDKGTERIYVKLYKKDRDNEYVKDFTYYLTFEIIVNTRRIQHETIETLEEIFLSTNEHMIAYALCHIYLENNFSTLNSDLILRKAVEFLEQDNYVFPVFKLIKDKTIMTPYIEKNQPFVYRTLPNKNVYLYYKVEGQAQYRQKKMMYRHFGMYMTTLLHFYGDKITYYFSEHLPTGSIDSKESSVFNGRINLKEGLDDPYYEINNALIYEQMFKYDIVEKIITERLKEVAEVKGKIL